MCIIISQNGSFNMQPSRIVGASRYQCNVFIIFNIPTHYENKN